MHFQIEVLAPSYVGAMQPPTAVQKRERVLCLPLARSALPCRLTRHSALGTVRLCPVGLARHSTPVGSARLALLSWLCTVGSARLALLNWLCSVGSARLALLRWLCTVGSATMYGTGYQNAVRNCPMQHGGCQMQLTGCPSNCSTKLPKHSTKCCQNFMYGADGRNLQNTGCRTYASNKYGLTFAANRYQMQQTTAARRMQFSECYDKRSSRHTARTYVVLGIL
ncbi:hypothetical protein Acr_08g0009720 [Actinidia rufa]|uniref:Uncharacterized protein n=1 Tax=Actinidia rufa TaxID=165716 RepID=A0A7J0F2B3_9ERIC|nr:hypothetical protein Acr_08g0009720 [Actinidia rufa]